MACFEDGRLVWSDGIHGRFAGAAEPNGGHYFDHAPETAFLNRAMHEAGCRPEVRHADGRPVFEDEGRIPDWQERFPKGLEIAFGISACQEAFDAGRYPPAAVYRS